jgi:hypothetical protein
MLMWGQPPSAARRAKLDWVSQAAQTFPLTESLQSLNMASGDMSPEAIWTFYP